MSDLSRFDPFGDPARYDGLSPLDDFFKAFRMKPAVRGFDPEPRIRMDVTENEASYTVKAEIPGVRKEDIKVDIDGNRVSIDVSARREKVEKDGEAVVRSERYAGRQFRSFTVAHDIDETRTEARYLDGVLELKLPKRSGSSAKRVVVS